ncbi:MAG TPA: hypothetical protein VFE55_10035 [Acidimicrobiia bacterium]|nr:hypothetical protein [Acidimicrobiia bacterium]
MSRDRLWKSVAGATCAAALVLGGAGVAGAVTVAPTGNATSVRTADESPIPDCHSAEHAFMGAIVNCKNQHNGQSSGR